MALLPILRYPDERLHTVAEPVKSVNGEIRQLIEDMAQTMYAAPGVGLAAMGASAGMAVDWPVAGATAAASGDGSDIEWRAEQ